MKYLEEIMHDDEKEYKDSRYGKRMGARGSLSDKLEEMAEELYECGYKEGYREAMKEADSYYGERSSYKRSMR